MTTLHDLTDDDTTVIDMFLLLDRDGKDEIFRAMAINACYAVAVRNADAKGKTIDDSPFQVTYRALMRCRPYLPSNYSVNEGLPWEVDNRFYSRLEERAVRMVLTTEERIAGHAQTFADWADEFANDLGWHREDGQSGEDEPPALYVEACAMDDFIREWRDSFFENLTRSALTGR